MAGQQPIVQMRLSSSSHMPVANGAPKDATSTKDAVKYEELPDMPGWRLDPKGGYIRLPPPPEPEPGAPVLEYGWKYDPDGSGSLIRMSDAELPAPFRPGVWCKIAGLEKDQEKNGITVEVITTVEDRDGTVEIKCAHDRTPCASTHATDARAPSWQVGRRDLPDPSHKPAPDRGL